MKRLPGRDHLKLLSNLEDISAHSKTMGSGAMKAMQLLETRAAMHYQKREYIEAISVIDLLIAGSAAKNLIGLGKSFYFRGKCLQAMINSHSLQLPVVLKSERSGSEPTDTVVTLNNKGDLLQECDASFRKAYHYFGSVGDELRVAQTLAHIAKTFLDHLFFSVAFLHVPYDLLSHYQEFSVSQIAKPIKDDRREKRSKEEVHNTHEPRDFIVSLKNSIEAPAELAMKISSELFNPLLMLKWFSFFFIQFHFDSSSCSFVSY
jgi:hypothetical protein